MCNRLHTGRAGIGDLDIINRSLHCQQKDVLVIGLFTGSFVATLYA